MRTSLVSIHIPTTSISRNSTLATALPPQQYRRNNTTTILAQRHSRHNATTTALAQLHSCAASATVIHMDDSSNLIDRQTLPANTTSANATPNHAQCHAQCHLSPNDTRARAPSLSISLHLPRQTRSIKPTARLPAANTALLLVDPARPKIASPPAVPSPFNQYTALRVSLGVSLLLGLLLPACAIQLNPTQSSPTQFSCSIQLSSIQFNPIQAIYLRQPLSSARRALTRSLVHLLAQLLTCSLIYSLAHSPVHSCSVAAATPCPC
ncbi:hypothetical protein GQ42DRAFT_25195 [Ramicandelaber brevisporus]|nr:hypothetical protein GQ42DRAFT_25195 [Ramicandelaber brevisporus]